jgi:hypothetical protein
MVQTHFKKGVLLLRGGKTPSPPTSEVPAIMPANETPQIIYIPDTLRNWPWPRDVNPYYAVCKKESSAWAEGFRAFSPKAQKAFNKCDFSQSFVLWFFYYCSESQIRPSSINGIFALEQRYVDYGYIPCRCLICLSRWESSRL